MIVILLLADKALEYVRVGRVLGQAVRLEDVESGMVVSMTVCLYDGHTDPSGLISDVGVHSLLHVIGEVWSPFAEAVEKIDQGNWLGHFIVVRIGPRGGLSHAFAVGSRYRGI